MALRLSDSLPDPALPTGPRRNGHGRNGDGSNGNGSNGNGHHAGPKVVAAASRSHRVLGLDLRSVARASFLFYSCVFAALLVAGFVLWVVASLLGVVGNVEQFMDDMGFDGFHFLSGTLVAAAVLLGAAGVAICTVGTVVAAGFFNTICGVSGGIDVMVAPDMSPDPEHARLLPAGPRPDGVRGR